MLSTKNQLETIVSTNRLRKLQNNLYDFVFEVPDNTSKQSVLSELHELGLENVSSQPIYNDHFLRITATFTNPLINKLQHDYRFRYGVLD